MIITLRIARQGLEQINAKLIKNISDTVVFENQINKTAVSTLELLRKKQAIKHLLATTPFLSKKARLEKKRLLAL